MEMELKFKYFSGGMDDITPTSWKDEFLKEIQTRKLYCHPSNYAKLYDMKRADDIIIRTSPFMDKEHYYMTKDIERKIENNIVTFY